MKTEAIIIDDEEGARSILSALVRKHFPQIIIRATFDNLLDGVEHLKSNETQIVFLDIEMPNYAGYEIGDFFEKINFNLIFVTAYDQFAIKAFELSAVDYLLKPILTDRFKQAVSKALTLTKNEQIADKYSVLLNNLDKDNDAKILVPTTSGQKIIHLKNIVAVEAKQAYSLIHTDLGDSFLYSKNLKFFEELLVKDKEFIRTHRSWIVSKSKILTYSKSKYEISLKGGLTAKFSKYKKDDFESEILN